MIPCGMMRPWRSLSAKACKTCMCFRAVSWCPLFTAPTGRDSGDSESRIHRTCRHGAVKSSSLSLNCRGQSSRMASPEPTTQVHLLDYQRFCHRYLRAEMPVCARHLPGYCEKLHLCKWAGQAGGCAHPSCSTSHRVVAIHQGSEYQVPPDVHPHHMSMCDSVSTTPCWDWYSIHSYQLCHSTPQRGQS